MMKIEPDKLVEELKDFVNEELLNGEEDIDVEENLLRDGMIDSIGMVRFVTYIQENYDLIIPAEDLTIENFQSLQIIADYLNNRELNG